MRVFRKLILVTVAFAAFLPPDVFAASATFNTLFFKPATGRNAYLMLNSTDVLKQFQFQVGELASYGYRPLEIRDAAGRRVQGVVEYTLVSDFVGAVGLLDWLQIGFDFPFALVDEFRDPALTTATPMANKMGLSDLRFDIKARLLSPCEFPVGLALIPFLSVPIGRDGYYLGDPGFGGGLRIAVDGRVHRRIGLTFNTGYQGGKKIQIRNIDFQHRLLIGAGVNAQLNKGVSVFGEFNADSDFWHFLSDRDMNPAEAMAGVKWDIGKTGVTVSAAGGNCVVCGVKGALARAVLGVSYRYSSPPFVAKEEAENRSCVMRFEKGMTPEKIYELKMNCPPDPADFKSGVHSEECPKFYELSDLADLMMRCPARPDEFVAGVHDEACQKVFTLGEAYSEEDINSVYTLMAAELELRCPVSADEFNPKLHDEACHKYYDLREISATTSLCPPDPQEYRPGVDDASCPTFYALRGKYSKDQLAIITKLSKLDTDKDGVNDYLDLCPREPEDFEGFADADGCPEGGILAIAGGEIQTFKPVYFEFNSIRMDYDATQVTDQVIGLINRTPWIKRVIVGGHADALGTVRANEKISMERAKSVISYMKSHGVRNDVLLEGVGYGARKPIVAGASEEARAKNRRVVFTIATEGFAP